MQGYEIRFYYNKTSLLDDVDLLNKSLDNVSGISALEKRCAEDLYMLSLRMDAKNVLLYCLLQDVSDISISYKNEYYVMDVSGGDGAYGNFWELWFDDNRIKKTIVFGNAEKSDTTAIIVHKEVVYN